MISLRNASQSFIRVDSDRTVAQDLKREPMILIPPNTSNVIIPNFSGVLWAQSLIDGSELVVSYWPASPLPSIGTPLEEPEGDIPTFENVPADNWLTRLITRFRIGVGRTIIDETQSTDTYRQPVDETDDPLTSDLSG